MANIENNTPKMAFIRYSIVSLVISFILLSISVLYTPMYVYASESTGSVWTDSEKLRWYSQKWYYLLTDAIGVIISMDIGDLQEDYRRYVMEEDWIQNNLTYDEWVADSLNLRYEDGDSGNADVSMSADMVNSMKAWWQEYASENLGFIYVYSSID